MTLPFVAKNSTREKIEELLKEYGEDSLSYFHLQDERQYFFSPSGRSCLSYKVFHRIALVAADPLGPKEELALLVMSFLQYCSSWNLIPMFVGISSEFARLIEMHTGLKITKIGEEAVIPLDTFDVSKLKKKVRRAVRHVESFGVEAFFFTSVNLPDSIRKQIEDISQLWIDRHGGKEKGFSMTLRRLPKSKDKDCQFVVATLGNQVVGYASFVPGFTSGTLSLDHCRSLAQAPNGLNEFLIIKSAQYFKSNNLRKLSLNFVVFSNLQQKSVTKLHLRRLITQVLVKLYKAHSLRTFNEKFLPYWENRYVAYSSLKNAPLYLLAILRAER